MTIRLEARRLDGARLLAILVPNALLWGAIGFQYLGGLIPCEMCMWQRWPHVAAIVLALVAIALRGRPTASRGAAALAALAILVSGGIGVYHAGVEYEWWSGFTACAAPITGGSAKDIIAQIMAAPIERCDTPQWTFHGLSLAGFNALFSFAFGGMILWLLRKRA